MQSCATIVLCRHTYTHTDTQKILSFNMTTEKEQVSAFLQVITVQRKHQQLQNHSPSVPPTAGCWVTHHCRSRLGSGVGAEEGMDVLTGHLPSLPSSLRAPVTCLVLCCCPLG